MCFDTAKSYNGNGLINMKKRSKEINAELNIESGEAIGTSIELKLKT
jgi:signal transduction histidine kinase